jgi:RimJ/RimL family protein N-acetyltransferase
MIEALSLEKIREFQLKLIEQNLPAYYAVDQGKVVGWADVTVSANPRLAHRGHLGMGILQDYRNQGLGTKLLSAAIEHARKVGLEKIELGVYASNPRAHALYKKLGFVEIGVNKKWRKLDGEYFDTILMELFL